MAIDFGRQFRRAGAQILDFDTQRRLLEKEKAEKLRQGQQAEARAHMLKIATSLDTPAGVAATREIVGNTFDPTQELEFRRLRTVLEPSLKAGQYDLLNPLAARVGLQGQFGPTPLEHARVGTERMRTEERAQAAEAQKAQAEQRRQAAKIRESESRFRISKIDSDIRLNRARLAKLVGDLSQNITQGNFSQKDVFGAYDNFDKVERDYAAQLEKMRELPDFEIEDPESGGFVVNPKYMQKIEEIERLQRQVADAKAKLVGTLLSGSEQARALDAATGGQIAGNAGENVQQRLAEDLIAREFPEIGEQIKRERLAKHWRGAWVRPPGTTTIPAPAQTPAKPTPQNRPVFKWSKTSQNPNGNK